MFFILTLQEHVPVETSFLTERLYKASAEVLSF